MQISAEQLSDRGEAKEAPSESFAQLWQSMDESGEGYHTLRRGEVVDGKVIRLDRDGLWVDIGAKTEGVVPVYELQSMGDDMPQSGDDVLVYVVNPEGGEGRVLLSLERARMERDWRNAQRIFEAGETVEAEVIDCNRGGLIVGLGQVQGFVPMSQLAGGRPAGDTDEAVEERLRALKGTTLRLKIIEMKRRRNRLVLSERAAIAEWRLQQRERLLTEIREGEVRRGRVTSIRSFGAFVDLGGVDGLVHLSELSWRRVAEPSEVVNVGDEVDVYVLRVDPDTKRIGLSLRRADREPWESLARRFQLGQLVTGTVTKLVPFGAFVRIDDGMEGLIHVSELSERHIAHPKEVVHEGDMVTMKIVKVDPEHYRLGLSLRRAAEEIT